MIKRNIGSVGAVVSTALGLMALYELMRYVSVDPVQGIVNSAITITLAVAVYLGSQWYAAKRRRATVD